MYLTFNDRNVIRVPPGPDSHSPVDGVEREIPGLQLLLNGNGSYPNTHYKYPSVPGQTSNIFKTKTNRLLALSQDSSLFQQACDKINI